jgi:hypothetical protein
MADSEAEMLMASLFALADVTVQAFKQRRRASEQFIAPLVPGMGSILTADSDAIT